MSKQKRDIACNPNLKLADDMRGNMVSTSLRNTEMTSPVPSWTARIFQNYVSLSREMKLMLSSFTVLIALHAT
jgi:hypothetical protein